MEKHDIKQDAAEEESGLPNFKQRPFPPPPATVDSSEPIPASSVNEAPPGYQPPILQQLALQPPPVPVSFDTAYITKGETFFKVVCYDPHFFEAEVLDAGNTRLFTFHRKGWLSTWNIRRSLLDARDQKRVLDLVHYDSTLPVTLRKNAVEDPQGKRLARIHDLTKGVPTYGPASMKSGSTTVMECVVQTEQGDVTIMMYSNDRTGTKTEFQVNGVAVAELDRTVFNHEARTLTDIHQSEWNLRIAGSMDYAMILALAFARIEVAHVRRR